MVTGLSKIDSQAEIVCLFCCVFFYRLWSVVFKTEKEHEGGGEGGEGGRDIQNE